MRDQPTGHRPVTDPELEGLVTKQPTGERAALDEATRTQLLGRLLKVTQTTPSVAREVTQVELILHKGRLDRLPEEWCKRLRVPVRAVNKGRILDTDEEICGPRGEPMVEIDRVVFDEQLREGAPGGDVWLEVALVHPADLRDDYRCSISTRFTLDDEEVIAKVAAVQARWSERLNAYFFGFGEAKRYIVDPTSGKLTRAYGARSRYRIAADAVRVYGYLEPIARSWDEHGKNPKASASSIRNRVFDDMPKRARMLFPFAKEKERAEGSDGRPKLKVELVTRVGKALGYVGKSGERHTEAKERPAKGEIDERLLRVVANVLARKYGRKAETLLQTVVRPALLGRAFTGFAFTATERTVRKRPTRSPRATQKRHRKPSRKMK